MTVEEILLKLGVDTSSVASQLRTTREHLVDWAKGIKKDFESTAIGDAITKSLANPIIAASGLLTAFAAKVYSTFSEMEDRASALKINSALANSDPMAIQPWLISAQATGGSGEAIGKSMLKVAEAAEKVRNHAEGSRELLKSFNELGVSLHDIETKDYHQIWEKIAESMHKAKLSQEELVSGAEIMGKSFETLLPMFSRGKDNPLDQLKQLGEGEYKDLIEIKKQTDANKAIIAKMWEEVVTGMTSSMAGRPRGLYGALADASLGPLFWLQRKLSGTDALRAAMDADAENKDKTGLLKKPSDDLSKFPTKSDADKIKRLNEESARLEEQHQLAMQPLAEKVAQLHLERNRLQEEYNDKTKEENEHALLRNDLAKKNVEIDKADAELKEKKLSYQKEADELQRKIMTDDSRVDSEFMPTIEQLAKSGHWFKGWAGNMLWKNGRYAGTAQEIERLSADTTQAYEQGDLSRVDSNKKRIFEDRTQLSLAGVQPMQSAMDKLADSSAASRAALDVLVKKAIGEGINVNVPMTK